MVAEEIDVAYERVRVVMGDSALTLDMGGASAAIGVSHGGTMLRRTAAETRRLLIEMASEKLGVPVERAHRHRRRRARRRGPDQARVLCRADRRALSRQDREMERPAEQRLAGRSPGGAEEACRVQDHRPVAAAQGPAGQGVRHARNGQRRAAARHAACAHDPPDGGRRGAGEGRREHRSSISRRARRSGSRTCSRSSPRRNGTRSRPRVRSR